MDPDSTRSSGSVVESNVIQFLASKKCESREVGLKSQNFPRTQPRPHRREFSCTHCGQSFSSYCELEAHFNVCNSRHPATVPSTRASTPESIQLDYINYGSIKSVDVAFQNKHSTSGQLTHDKEIGVGFLPSATKKLVHSTANQDSKAKNVPKKTAFVSSSLDNIVTVVDSPNEDIARGEKLYKCSVCGLSNDKTAYLYKHMKTAHPNLSIIHKRALDKRKKMLSQLKSSDMVSSTEIQQLRIGNKTHRFEIDSVEETFLGEEEYSGNFDGVHDAETSFDKSKLSKHVSVSHEMKSLWDFSSGIRTDDQKQIAENYCLSRVNDIEIGNSSESKTTLPSSDNQMMTKILDNCAGDGQPLNKGSESDINDKSNNINSLDVMTENEPIGIYNEAPDVEIMIVRNRKGTDLATEKNEVCQEVSRSKNSSDKNDPTVANEDILLQNRNIQHDDSQLVKEIGNNHEYPVNEKCKESYKNIVSMDANDIFDSSTEHLDDDKHQNNHITEMVDNDFNTKEKYGQLDANMTSPSLPQSVPVTTSKVSVLSFQVPLKDTEHYDASKTDNLCHSSMNQNNERGSADKVSILNEPINLPSGKTKIVRVVDIVGNGRHRYKCSECDVTSNSTSNLYLHMLSTHKDMTIVKKRKTPEHLDGNCKSLGNISDRGGQSMQIKVTNRSAKSKKDALKDAIVIDGDMHRVMDGALHKEKTVHVIKIPNMGSHRYQCSACLRTANSTGGLYDHMRRVHKDLRIIYRNSGDVPRKDDSRSVWEFEENTSYDGDDTVHVIDLPDKSGVGSLYQCSKCGSTCNNLSNMYKHMRRMHIGMPIAKRIRKTKRSVLELDQSITNEGAGNLIDNREETFYESEENVSNSEDTEQQNYSKCSKSFLSVRNLKSHIGKEHKARQSKGYLNSRDSLTDTQMKTSDESVISDYELDTEHLGNDSEYSDEVRVIDIAPTKDGHRFKCSKCGDSFRYLGSIHRHMRTLHRGMTLVLQKKRYEKYGPVTALFGESEHKNKVNGNSTNDGGAVCRIYVSTHGADRRYKCSECCMTFHSRNHAERHAKKVHKEMTVVYQTSLEGSGNDSDKSVDCSTICRIDVSTRKVGKRYTCYECHSTFSNTRAVERHVKRTHRDMTVVYNTSYNLSAENESQMDYGHLNEGSDREQTVGIISSNEHTSTVQEGDAGSVLGKRDRESRRSNSSDWDGMNEHNVVGNVDISDEDVRAKKKKNDKSERNRLSLPVNSASKSNGNRDCNVAIKHNDAPEGFNERMEKIHREGVTILSMPTVLHKVNVIDKRDCGEHDKEITDTSITSGYKDSNNEFENENNSDIASETETTINSVKQNRFSKMLVPVVEQIGNNSETGINSKTTAGYQSLFNELDFVRGDLRDVKNAVWPIMFFETGGKPRYKCSECELICNVTSNLYKHMKKVHRGMTVLQRKASRRSVLNESELNSRLYQGLRQDVNDSPNTVQILQIPPTKEGHKYKCSRCNVICRDSSNMYKHMKRMHKGLNILRKTRCKKLDVSGIFQNNNVHAMEELTSIYGTIRDESHIDDVRPVKTVGKSKSFWEYSAYVVGDDSPKDVSEDNFKVQQDGVTRLKMVPANHSYQVLSEKNFDETRNDLTSVRATYSVSTVQEQHNDCDNESNGVTDIGNATQLFIEVRNDSTISGNNSLNTTAAQQSNPMLSPVKGPCTSKEDNETQIQLNVGNTGGTVHVIDVPAGRNRLRYKCSECEIVCNEIGNLYKHIRRMHKDLVFLPRPRKNKAWYSKMWHK